MQPLNNNVLIKRDPLPENKVGSIIIPDTFAGGIHKVRDRGEIIAIGEKVKLVQTGQRVIFGRFSYQDFDKDKDLIIVKECDLLGVINV